MPRSDFGKAVRYMLIRESHTWDLRKSAILFGFEFAGRRIALPLPLWFSVIFEYGGLIP